MQHEKPTPLSFCGPNFKYAILGGFGGRVLSSPPIFIGRSGKPSVISCFKRTINVEAVDSVSLIGSYKIRPTKNDVVDQHRKEPPKARIKFEQRANPPDFCPVESLSNILTAVTPLL
ncbi:hypothetical protein CDAR_393241 [Caerostris darwini]|uniref:Uncharacterized protein n=1 Tax=Caerostris darwini TaxID=1538125 RepID=A0AAV4UZX4_9ARAC|nr:hypothetical protein CDAR_393241 [Caerostris darwini]